jgi:hypothetical protein
VEAFKLMGCVKRPVCQASVLFFSLFLIPQSLLLSPSAQAQATAPNPAPATAAPQSTPPAQTPEERARILREAQDRINARRQAKIQQIIRETYSHKYEADFGGGYLRFKPGEMKQHMNEGAWNIGFTDYIKPRLGITADVRGYYGSAYIGNNPYGVFQPSISQYSFLFGPQYRIYMRPKWAVSVQALAGFGHGNFDTGTGGLPAGYIGLYPDATVFNLSLGAPLDYNLSPGLAIRVTPLYLLSFYGGDAQNNLGFNAGVVYRWGKR